MDPSSDDRGAAALSLDGTCDDADPRRDPPFFNSFPWTRRYPPLSMWSAEYMFGGGYSQPE